MTFDPTQVLVIASSRAKSDVANKLVSMVLHKLSLECLSGLTVRSQAYRMAVHQAFGDSCPYCGRRLERNTTVAEHLDAMNRFRAGLHVPGNVLPACKACNSKKRRDDQQKDLRLADSGWANFLSHDGTKCSDDCPTCSYWVSVLGTEERTEALSRSRQRIEDFRVQYLPPLAPSMSARAQVLLWDFYKESQGAAAKMASEVVARVLR
ncbi:MAG TPA: HNH endonuclease signature motif containing protein [Symbiobacteriaceae bacterium]|nr:HNH endonuclease signature motif containing protein [Symbiobacteriaceae bacterium]